MRVARVPRHGQPQARELRFPAMKPRVRELLHATPFQPFIIRMADGRKYFVDHPDFVLAASNEQTQVLIEDKVGCTIFRLSL
jgi:hypothetical protein